MPRGSLIRSKPKSIEVAAELMAGWIAQGDSLRNCCSKATSRWGFTREQGRRTWELAVAELQADLAAMDRQQVAAISIHQRQHLQQLATEQGDYKAAAMIARGITDDLQAMPAHARGAATR
jgi:hypothetical protein